MLPAYYEMLNWSPSHMRAQSAEIGRTSRDQKRFCVDSLKAFSQSGQLQASVNFRMGETKKIRDFVAFRPFRRPIRAYNGENFRRVPSDRAGIYYVLYVTFMLVMLVLVCSLNIWFLIENHFDLLVAVDAIPITVNVDGRESRRVRDHRSHTRRSQSTWVILLL